MRIHGSFCGCVLQCNTCPAPSQCQAALCKQANATGSWQTERAHITCGEASLLLSLLICHLHPGHCPPQQSNPSQACCSQSEHGPGLPCCAPQQEGPGHNNHTETRELALLAQPASCGFARAARPLR